MPNLACTRWSVTLPGAACKLDSVAGAQRTCFGGPRVWPAVRELGLQNGVSGKWRELPS
jgi:hypothetical protein